MKKKMGGKEMTFVFFLGLAIGMGIMYLIDRMGR